MTEVVASEVGALVIHLSTTSIGNKFEDGNDATKLIHMVFTVAKEESLSPVIIYLDDCHEFFVGKAKKKGGGSEAINMTMKRFQKDLLIYKNQYLTKEDRVLVIGCTNMPEAGDMKLMKWKGSGGKAEKQGFFEHALYLPNTSHSGRLLLWKKAISKKVTSRCQLDFSLLAHMSSDYSAGKIFKIVDEVLSDDDRLKNLTEHDFAPKLLPNTEQNDQQFVDFRRQWNGSKTKGDAAAPKKKKSK
jgi:ATP-dependent 26S proteasome regulatory subunit